MVEMLKRLPFLADADNSTKYYGVVGNFDSPEDLLRAIRTVRLAGYSKLEAYTPFPIHGLDEAMGEGRSPLGRFVLIGGLLGLISAVALQWWTGAVDYKLVIAGKPLFAFEPSVPIMFELTVLFASFAAVLGMLGLNKLPQYYHSFFRYSRHMESTNDRFLLAVESSDPKFDADDLITLLHELGSRHTELVEA